MSSREPANLDEARAQAAERMLERKRMGLESAVEALETVGYRVIQRDDGTYAVRPPYVRTVSPDDDKPGKITTQPVDFLSDYPVLLTAKHVAEITGMHVNRVRALFNKQVLPASKLDNGHWYLPKQKFMELFDVQSGKVEKPWLRDDCARLDWWVVRIAFYADVIYPGVLAVSIRKYVCAVLLLDHPAGDTPTVTASHQLPHIRSRIRHAAAPQEAATGP